MKRFMLAGAVVLFPASASAGGAGDFAYLEPGDLTPGSGEGAEDYTVYAPGMRYPIEVGPSFPNSQVWGHGGGSGPGGGQCDLENYSYPWRDNYCETRSWDMPLCPSGVGHQGQDIRPSTCDAATHWTVASQAGTVTHIGGYSVYVTAADGTRFDYLHGSGNAVSNGQALEQGERINLVDNEFGGTPTTIHLHYNIKQDVAGVGFVFVSPYMSLVESYQELLGIGGEVVGEAAVDACSAVVGWAQDENEPDVPIAVQVHFDGSDGVAVEILADEYRESLCDLLGSCEHGFTLELPRSLRDGQPHTLALFAGGSEDSASVELDSPPTFTCERPAIPEGEVRLLEGPETVAAWGISPFWDAVAVDHAVLDARAEGEPFPAEPVLVRSDDPADGDTVWWMDPGSKREVESDAVIERWGLSPDDVQSWPADVLAEVPEGPPMRDEVFVLEAPDGSLYVVDDPPCDGVCEPSGGGTGGGSGGGTGTGGDTDDSVDTEAEADIDGGEGGCGCRSNRSSSAAALMLLAIVALRGRRPTATEA